MWSVREFMSEFQRSFYFVKARILLAVNKVKVSKMSFGTVGSLLKWLLTCRARSVTKSSSPKFSTEKGAVVKVG